MMIHKLKRLPWRQCGTMEMMKAGYVVLYYTFSIYLDTIQTLLIPSSTECKQKQMFGGICHNGVSRIDDIINSSFHHITPAARRCYSILSCRYPENADKSKIDHSSQGVSALRFLSNY